MGIRVNITDIILLESSAESEKFEQYKQYTKAHMISILQQKDTSEVVQKIASIVAMKLQKQKTFAVKKCNCLQKVLIDEATLMQSKNKYSKQDFPNTTPLPNLSTKDTEHSINETPLQEHHQISINEKHCKNTTIFTITNKLR
ncbi:hypothetical protein PoB_003582900 [Plakobranchus ocellatus]|uniref:Uncharacterized protein n=1 Tax=Plakobranchus ocellatus TaxID=259542 RepID=A0AAV4ASL3_9GAST|nr:hypothetical protein PoB_003582900 [Plakobranchus ocellatus]